MGMVSKRFSAGGADAPSFLGHHLSLGPLGVALLHGKYNTNLPPPQITAVLLSRIYLFLETTKRCYLEPNATTHTHDRAGRHGFG